MAALPLLAVFGLLATYAHAASTARTAALASVTLTAIPQEKVPHGTPVRVAWTISGSTTSVCSLDGRPGRVCTSPQTLTDLGVGRHRLAITARARRGSATVTITWEVVAPPSSAPEAPPAAAPPAPAPPAPAPPAPSAPPAAPAAPAVTPPAEPGPYQVPANAVVVRTSAELTAALAGPSQDIVLADGTYDAATPFSNTNGHRLYAQNLGRATLRAGLVVGGNFGAPTTIVRGITFDVSATAKVLGGAIVHVWGPGGANAKLLDCVFRGNSAIPYGVLALNPSGLVLQRAQFSSFTDVAARISDNTRVTYGNATPVVDTITDVSIDGVSRSVPGASKGTAEAGLWVGHPVRNGVTRIRVRNVSWAGIETVNNSWDTRFSDLEIDMSGPRQAAGVGVYMEHYTRNVVFERFTVRGARTGFNGEWADPATGGKPGAHAVTIRSGRIDSAGTTLSGRQAGVYLDEGSYQTTVTGVTFANQNWAGIGAFRNAGANSFTQNTFRLSSGAVEVSTDHI